MTPSKFARELVWSARKERDTSPTCEPPNRSPKAAFNRLTGWSFGLDVYEHRDEKKFEKLPGDVVRVHYRLSAKLFPPGRSSTSPDWRNLGTIVAAIVHATGYPEDRPLPEPVLPLESTHPNSTMHWMWHADGSAVSEEVLKGTAAVLSALQAQEYEAAISKGLAVPIHSSGEKHERNAPCPCGSGKKFKKCHGAPN